VGTRWDVPLLHPPTRECFGKPKVCLYFALRPTGAKRVADIQSMMARQVILATHPVAARRSTTCSVAGHEPDVNLVGGGYESRG
jgi:hypothetical protein